MATTTWDAEEYKKRALEREDDEKRGKKKSKVSEKDEFLEGRDKAVDLEKEVSKDQGFVCKVCELKFQDSNSYLTHLNSSAHQSKLGISLKVERASVDQVKSKIREKVQEKYSKHKNRDEEKTKATMDFEQRADALLEEEKERKRKKKLEKKRRKEEEQEQGQGNDDEADEQMKMMLGFSSFG